MANKLVKSLSLAIILATAALSSAQISFQSGNGVAGAQDSQVSFIAGPATADFSTFDSSTFLNYSSTAQKAYILTPLAGGWVTGLGSGSTAQWVGVSPTAGSNSAGNSTSGLFAISFYVPQAIQQAGLHLIYSADDQLGGSNNSGLYIDGKAIANSNTGSLWDGVINNQEFGLGSLSQGTHTLYFDDVNSAAGPAGVIFQGTVQSVPEPSSIAVCAVGMLGLIRRRFKKA